MKRGEVWWVDFEPAVGSEVKKVRPAVIVKKRIGRVSAPEMLGIEQALRIQLGLR